MTIRVYTDGSVAPTNPGPAGWPLRTKADRLILPSKRTLEVPMTLKNRVAVFPPAAMAREVRLCADAVLEMDAQDHYEHIDWVFGRLLHHLACIDLAPARIDELHDQFVTAVRCEITRRICTFQSLRDEPDAS